MNITITVKVLETDSRGLQILEDLEIARDENEGARISTAGAAFTCEIIEVTEAPNG